MLPKVVLPSIQRLRVVSFLPASIDPPLESVAGRAQCTPSRSAGSNQPTVDVTPKVSVGVVAPTCLRLREISHSSHGSECSTTQRTSVRDPFVVTSGANSGMSPTSTAQPSPTGGSSWSIRRSLWDPPRFAVRTKRSAPNRIHHHRCASGVEPATSGRCPDRRTAKDRQYATLSRHVEVVSDPERATHGERSIGISFRSVQPCGRCAQPSDLFVNSVKLRKFLGCPTERQHAFEHPALFRLRLDTKSSPNPAAGQGPRKGDVD